MNTVINKMLLVFGILFLIMFQKSVSAIGCEESCLDIKCNPPSNQCAGSIRCDDLIASSGYGFEPGTDVCSSITSVTNFGTRGGCYFCNREYCNVYQSNVTINYCKPENGIFTANESGQLVVYTWAGAKVIAKNLTTGIGGEYTSANNLYTTGINVNANDRIQVYMTTVFR
jgi:hypothetical protein